MISNANKKIILNEEIKKLEKLIQENAVPILIDLDVDVLEFTGSPEEFPFLIEQIEAQSIAYHLPHVNRSNRSFQLWYCKEIESSHFMSTTCTASQNFMNVPISESYGNDFFKSKMDQHGLYQYISEHCNLIKVDGLFSITYCESSNQNMFPDIRDLHPHFIAHTLHELLKLMMEWEWCYLNMQTTEPIAELSHLALVNMGISIEKLEKSKVVQSIWALPDMYVAQFLKGIPRTVSVIDPPEPSEYKLWISQSGIFNFTKHGLGHLYAMLIRWKSLNEKINQL
jgi:hypothetical protein